MAQIKVREINHDEAVQCVDALVAANPLLLPGTPGDFARLVELRRAYDAACVDYAQRHGLVGMAGYVAVEDARIVGVMPFSIAPSDVGVWEP